jgi:drug/metabolite transporter (DMT)-like permease
VTISDAIDRPPRATASTTSLPARSASGLLVLLIVVLGNDWGLQYAAAKLMANEGVHAVGSLYAMHLALMPVFLLFLVLRRALHKPRLSHLVFFAAIGALGNVGQLGSELVAANHVSAGELTLINSFIPLFIIFIVIVFRTEPLSRAKFAALLLGCAAASAIILPDALNEMAASPAWTAFAFISPISAAIATVALARFWPNGLDPIQVAAGSLVAGTLWLTPIALLSGETVTLIGETPGATWGTLLFLATAGLEFYLMALIVRLGGAVFASCADFIAVCAGLFWGFVFFTEIPTGWMVAAALLCLAALKLAADSTAIERRATVLPT